MQHRIVVLGAGYSGASAAGRLAKRLRREDVSVTLVNAEPDFVERVRLHQLATGRDLPSRPLAEMFEGTGVDLRVARVTAVDADRKAVTLTTADGPDELPYDTLVYALGSHWDDQGVPGAADHAHELAGRAGALRLREHLAALDAGRPVVVVGGGLTGLEAVTEIAEARPDLDVALVARDGLGDWLSDKGRRHLGRSSTGWASRCTSTPRSSASRPTWSSPPTARSCRPPRPCGPPASPSTRSRGPPPWRSPTPAGSSSTARCARSPTRTSTPSATRPGRWAPATSRCACRAPRAPSAWQAADAIAARLTGGKRKDVPLRYFNQCVSLGRKDGLIQYVTADDRAVPRALAGRIAAVYKELVCKGAVWAVAHPTLGMPTRRRAVVEQPASAGTAPAEAAA